MIRGSNLSQKPYFNWSSLRSGGYRGGTGLTMLYYRFIKYEVISHDLEAAIVKYIHSAKLQIRNAHRNFAWSGNSVDKIG